MQTCIWPSCCHCHSLSLASVKSRLILPFWHWLTQLVPEKGPLNVCLPVKKNLIKLVNIWQNCRKEGGLHVADREQKAVSYDIDDADAYNRSFCGLCSMDSVKIFLSVR